jgi:hypothetical protein
MTKRNGVAELIPQPLPPTAKSQPGPIEEALQQTVGPDPLEDAEGTSPPPAIMDTQLETAARKIKPIRIDPDDLDAAAKRIRVYGVRALNHQKIAKKLALRL